MIRKLHEADNFLNREAEEAIDQICTGIRPENLRTLTEDILRRTYRLYLEGEGEEGLYSERSFPQDRIISIFRNEVIRFGEYLEKAVNEWQGSHFDLNKNVQMAGGISNCLDYIGENSFNQRAEAVEDSGRYFMFYVIRGALLRNLR